MELHTPNPDGNGIKYYQQHHAGTDHHSGVDIPGRNDQFEIGNWPGIRERGSDPGSNQKKQSTKQAV